MGPDDPAFVSRPAQPPPAVDWARLESVLPNAGQREESHGRLVEAIRTVLECLGEDPQREGLARTPERMAQALLHCTRGYTASLPATINAALFEENHDEMVIVRAIPFYSLCEHHLLPFFGTVALGYIPRGRVLGLSKLARIVELYARRLQVQERMTKQVAAAVQEMLQPLGAAVVIRARHLCMEMRGVEKTESETVTSAMLGVFRADPKTREEFLSLTK